MPPTDNTPDFDSMSPEELMAWMETLAERQGANSEEFTTEQRYDIAEVDPTTVQDTGPGYIPYGMTEEQWAEKQQQEEEQKAAKRAQQQESQPAAPPPPPAQPEPTPAVASDGGEPDFDSMSPEELMAWMETLAERQGATEGFTTEDRVDIAEVDPTTAQETGPGYIPYGMTEEQWAEKQQQEEEQKAARLSQQQEAQPAAPPPPPASTPLPEIPDVQPELDIPDLEPAVNEFELPGLEPEFENTTQASTGGLDWLEDLAAEQDSNFPQMDLSGLGDDLAGGGLDLAALEESEETQASDTMSWLDDLAQGDDDVPRFDIPTDEPEIASEVVLETPPPPAPEPELEMPELDLDVSDEELELATSDEDDPMNWLESLAREQGANPEEFTTNADLSVADASAQDEEVAGYSFDADSVGDPLAELGDIDQLDAVNLEDESDPEAWLEGLATSQSAQPVAEAEGNDEEVDPKAQFKNDPLVQSAKEDGVMQALQSGDDLSSDDVRGWMDNLLSQGIQRSDDQGFQIPEEEIEEEEGDLEANIPDWLVDQVGPPPEAIDGEQTPPPAFVGDIEADADIPQDIPDWLQESAPTHDEEGLAGIFDDADSADEGAEDETAVGTLHESSEGLLETTLTIGDEVIVTDDQWAVAFELERTGQITDEVKEMAQDATILEEATLPPETTLAQGEPEAVPDWLSGMDDAPAVQEEAPVSPPPVVEEIEAVALDEDEMPDWLREMETQHDMEVVDSDDTPDWLDGADVDEQEVPEWLRDTITVDESDEIATIDPNIFTQEEEQPATPAPEPVAPPAQPAAMVPVQSPAPVAVMMSAEEAGAAIESARGKVNDGDLDSGLTEYENVIRANAQLDSVVGDLEKLAKDNDAKKNPLVHRVLGDGLMRQGRLQEALDTYRKALNLL